MDSVMHVVPLDCLDDAISGFFQIPKAGMAVAVGVEFQFAIIIREVIPLWRFGTVRPSSRFGKLFARSTMIGPAQCPLTIRPDRAAVFLS